MAKKKQNRIQAAEKQTASVLDRVNSPADLKQLRQDEIPQLNAEIRSFLVDHVTETGGHLASNLGVVELSVALHRVFDVPNDHIIWDVSHQCYVHKILTGRKDRFDTLRTPGGLSGFAKRDESEYDAFGAGHSSTSLSAALGFAEADRMAGKHSYTVAVVGDGAYTGGMIHEALNNCDKNLRLIIVLNENEMSISKNIGRFARSLSNLRSSPGYFRTKRRTAKLLHAIPLIGKWIFALLRNTKQFLKNALYGSNYFENLGIFYIGPIDGNDYARVEQALEEAKRIEENVVIHLKTVKGKGYAPAEEDPSRYHSIPPKNSKKPEGHNFSAEMGLSLTALASEDSDFQKRDRICAITAAMGIATGLSPFEAAYPSRYFDVGIAEEHALTFAAGLAANGYHPVVPIYSTFLQRGYDNIVHDIALQRLPVTICIDRAGLSTADGATHHGCFDVSFLSAIPGMRIYAPITFSALHAALKEAISYNGPSAIRYPNGYEDAEILDRFYRGGALIPDAPSVRADLTSEATPKTVIVTHGKIVKEAMRAADRLNEAGHPTGILLCEYLKPYDTLAETVLSMLPQSVDTLVYLEEEVRGGGFGVSLSDRVRRDKRGQRMREIILAPEESFVIPKTKESIYHTAGVDADAIVNAVMEIS